MIRPQDKTATASWLISLNIHIVVGLYLWLMPSFKRAPPEPPMILELTSSAAAEPPPPQKVPKKKREKTKTTQMVDTNFDPNNEQANPNAQFRGAHNQVVDHETVASHVGQHNEQSSSASSADNDNDAEPISADDPLIAKAKRESGKEDGAPSEGDMSDDNIKNKDKGMQTLLNTREYVYFSYYKVIKKQLGKYWEAKIKEKMVRVLAQGRNVASSHNQVTRLFIQIDQSGTLVGVQLVNKSGAKDLDEAAIEAFKEAAPFPVPPTGILEKDGTVKISWDFVLEANN